MIIHSVVPMSMIMENKESTGLKHTIEVEYKGELLEVQQISNNSCKVVRLISTSPDAYMDNEMQPGSILNLPSCKR